MISCCEKLIEKIKDIMSIKFKEEVRGITKSYKDISKKF